MGYSLKRLIATLFAAAAVISSASAETTSQKRELLKRHNKAFITLDYKIRDPFILDAKDGYYYLTGTTAGSNWGDTIGVKIWRSKDLCEWDDLGVVWDLNRDGNDSWYFNRPPHKPGDKRPYLVWAPEIHHFNDTWWLTVSRNGGGNGLLKSVTGKVEGPYETTDIHFDRNIDSHLFCDNGTIYYTYGSCQIARMSEDMESLADDKFTQLKLPGKHPMGYEGILMMNYQGHYLWIASGRYGYEPSNTYDLYYAVSKSLTSGYSPRRMMIKNAGHGNIIQDRDGQWWSTAFDHEFTDKWCCWLVPIDFKVVGDDVIVEVHDERFRPTEEDQDFVKRLAREGRPAEWEGKVHWWIPESKK